MANGTHLSQISEQDSLIVNRPGMPARSTRVRKNLHAALCDSSIAVRALTAMSPELN